MNNSILDEQGYQIYRPVERIAGRQNIRITFAYMGEEKINEVMAALEVVIKPMAVKPIQVLQPGEGLRV